MEEQDKVEEDEEEDDEEEDAAEAAAVNHVIVARFNWSGVRSAARWREDAADRGAKKGATGGRRGFVRVATRIRQSRGCTRRTVARAGAASAPPATPSRMETHLWSVPAGRGPPLALTGRILSLSLPLPLPLHALTYPNTSVC